MDCHDGLAIVVPRKEVGDERHGSVSRLPDFRFPIIIDGERELSECFIAASCSGRDAGHTRAPRG
jgi:hypothetical protein